MSQSDPKNRPQETLEGDIAGLSLALQRALARRGAMGARRIARVDTGPGPPSPSVGSKPAGRLAATHPPVPAATTAPAAPPNGGGAAPAGRLGTHEDTPGAPEAGPGREGARVGAAPPGRAAAPSIPEGPRPESLAPQAANAGTLAELEACVAECTACPLASARTQTVFGDGTGARRILFVGEAPGEEEDLQGVPFVGAAGNLLNDIITKGMGIARQDVYIANVVKCRPPGSRDPLPEEQALCSSWLDRQIELVDPLVIIPLGRLAAGHVLGVDAPLGRLRGKVHDHRGRKVVPTFHPEYLLRSPHEKRKTWEDIQLAMGAAGLSPRTP